MAKKPKVRKKAVGVDFNRRSMTTIVDHCYLRLKFLGDCGNKPVAIGVQKLWTHLAGKYHDEGLKIFHWHLNREMDWSINLSCYFKTDDELEKLKVVQVIAVFKACNMKEVSANLSDVICESILNVLDDTENYPKEDLIYYGYMVNPEFNDSHFKMGDMLTDVLANVINFSNQKPFGDAIPGIISDENTLEIAIKNNRLWPKVKEIVYENFSEEIIHDVDDFLIPELAKN